MNLTKYNNFTIILGSRRRGSIPPSNNRGRARNNPKYKWKSSSDYNSENTSAYQPRPRSNSKNSSYRNQGGSHHNAKGAGSDVSSPDLGVDLGSDPFSSLERTNHPVQQSKYIKVTRHPSHRAGSTQKGLQGRTLGLFLNHCLTQN